MEMYRDQFGEFVCAYWGLKGLKPMILNRINNINAVLALWASHFLLHFSQKYWRYEKQKKNHSNYFVIAKYYLYYTVNYA